MCPDSSQISPADGPPPSPLLSRLSAHGPGVSRCPAQKEHNLLPTDVIVSRLRDVPPIAPVTAMNGRGRRVVRYADRDCRAVSGRHARTVWQNRALKSHFTSPVLLDGRLYGIDGNAGRGKLRCLDVGSGEEKWAHDLGFGSLIAVGGKLIVLNERGNLFVAAADPRGYRQLASCKAVDARGAKCWTIPVLDAGRLYPRNSHRLLVCLDVSR